MSKVIFQECNISLSEDNASMLINPAGERFYFIPCESQTSVFNNATLTLDDEGNYMIEGNVTLFTKHKEARFNYEELVCKHPEELIHKRSFLGLLTWYKVSGTMKRELRVKHLCKHKAYTFDERFEVISRTCSEV